MHTGLARRFMSQGASHRFAVHRHLLFLLLAILPCQAARFILAALRGFPARQAA